MTWRRVARLAARSLNAAGNPILADVESALSACGPVERSASSKRFRLPRLGEHRASAGSCSATAHRGQRLRRFAELTGVDPMIPAGRPARVGWAERPGGLLRSTGSKCKALHLGDAPAH